MDAKKFGAFIAAIFNFLIIAFVIFSLVKILNASKVGFKKFENDILGIETSDSAFKKDKKLINLMKKANK